jgi:hypothetical protein
MAEEMVAQQKRPDTLLLKDPGFIPFVRDSKLLNIKRIMNEWSSLSMRIATL